jgi:PUA domain protein
VYFRISLKTSIISKTDTLKIVKIIRGLWPVNTVPKIKNLTVHEVDLGKYILKSANFTAIQISEGLILPFLANIEALSNFPFVKIDMGAVKFVCNGARVMRPGITHFSPFKKRDIVAVKDEVHQKMLAVGIALEDSDTASELSSGYVIDNLHYVGDKFWEAYKHIQ